MKRIVGLWVESPKLMSTEFAKSIQKSLENSVPFDEGKKKSKPPSTNPSPNKAKVERERVPSSSTVLAEPSLTIDPAKYDFY